MLKADRIALSGDTISEAGETPPRSDSIRLREHDTSAAFTASDSDIDFLQSLDVPQPIEVEFTRDDKIRFSTSQYVGVMTLPSGTQIEVTPKESVSNVLWALQFALGVDANTIDSPTSLIQANTFVDALGALFASALEEVLQRGIHRDYQRRQEVSETVRGQIDVQRQLQRSTPVPTDFAIDYEAHTADTVLNRGILTATRWLVNLVESSALSSLLDHQRHRLRKHVSQEIVTASELEDVDLTRLNNHYEVVLDIARIVLAEEFFDDLLAGEQRSFGLFVNMNSIFEAMVERAFRLACSTLAHDWRVEDQASIPELIAGPHAVSMTPDVVIRDSSEQGQLVADAKWKTGQSNSADVYQVTSYILAIGAPGFLVHPQQTGDSLGASCVNDAYQLETKELPTAESAPSYEAYRETLVQTVESWLDCLDN